MTVDPEPAPAAEPSTPASTTGGRRPVSASWNWLLVIPLIGTLIPPFFNKTDPELAGIPFFYWYQLLWIPIAVTMTLLVFRATRGADRVAGREAGHE